MAQFVTHIQPTLMESLQHHPPHYYHHHHHKEEHHKEGHHKECTTKDCHSKDCHKDHHKDAHHKECTVKDCHQKECHKKNGHHDKDSLKSMKSPPFSDESLKDSYSQSRKGSTGHFYTDSHGFKHEYDARFVDQQGICRSAEVRSHDASKIKDDQDRENEARSLQSKSDVEITKPVPPQFIDIQPVHGENKAVSPFNVI